MKRNIYKQFKNRIGNRPSPDFGTGRRFTTPRIIGACICLVGAIALALILPRLLNTGEETPDSVLRLTEADPQATSGVAVTVAPSTPTPEPTPTMRPKAVALTFDDGPKSAEPDQNIKGTAALLDTLKEYGVHVTFFVVGNRLNVDADILKREVDEGHEIGNHTWDHAQLNKLSMKDINKEIDSTSDLVKELTGYTVQLVRPPYGNISEAMRKKLKYPMILWSVDTEDWKNIDEYEPGEKEKAILKEVKKNVTDGSIILMHDIHETSCEAAKLVIPWLLDNGYDILTVSDLMQRKGINMKNGKVYSSAE